MEEVSWFPVVASLLGGGAVGALITAAAQALRNRRQPITYSHRVWAIFQDTLTDSSLPACLKVFDPAGAVEFDNLFVAEIQIQNRGNRDWPEFSMGITLGGGDTAIHVAFLEPDRHHSARLVTVISPSRSTRLIDLTLSPFNRRDLYTLRVYVVLAPNAVGPSHIELGSREPVVFRVIPPVAELTDKGLTIRVGPIRLILAP